MRLQPEESARIDELLPDASLSFADIAKILGLGLEQVRNRAKWHQDCGRPIPSRAHFRNRRSRPFKACQDVDLMPLWLELYREITMVPGGAVRIC